MAAQNLLVEGRKDRVKANDSKERNWWAKDSPIPCKLADRTLKGEFLYVLKFLPESWQVAEQNLETLDIKSCSSSSLG